jgi:hypothetical protein
MPEITVTDFSRPTWPRETTWRKALIECSSSQNVGKIITSEEDRQILVMLRDALRYADEVDGLVPTNHIDYVFDVVVTHIKRRGAREKENPSRKRQRGTWKRRKYKRYIYARTQELFDKDPGQLAKRVREGVSRLETDAGQLPTSEIKNCTKTCGKTIRT